MILILLEASSSYFPSLNFGNPVTDFSTTTLLKVLILYLQVTHQEVALHYFFHTPWDKYNSVSHTPDA